MNATNERSLLAYRQPHFKGSRAQSFLVLQSWMDPCRVSLVNRGAVHSDSHCTVFLSVSAVKVAQARNHTIPFVIVRRSSTMPAWRNWQTR